MFPKNHCYNRWYHYSRICPVISRINWNRVKFQVGKFLWKRICSTCTIDISVEFTWLSTELRRFWIIEPTSSMTAVLCLQRRGSVLSASPTKEERQETRRFQRHTFGDPYPNAGVGEKISRQRRNYVSLEITASTGTWVENLQLKSWTTTFLRCNHFDIIIYAKKWITITLKCGNRHDRLQLRITIALWPNGKHNNTFVPWTCLHPTRPLSLANPVVFIWVFLKQQRCRFCSTVGTIIIFRYRQHETLFAALKECYEGDVIILFPATYAGDGLHQLTDSITIKGQWSCVFWLVSSSM